MKFKLRKDDGEIPALGSLFRVRLCDGCLRLESNSGLLVDRAASLPLSYGR